MASSLEELLKEEGFKGSRRMTRSRSSFHSDAATMPRYSFQDQQRRLSVSSERIKTERAKSDVSTYQIRSGFLNGNSSRSRLARNSLLKIGKMEEGLKNQNGEKSSTNAEVSKEFISSSECVPRYEITEVKEKADKKVKDIHSNEVSNARRGKEKSLNGFKEREKWKEMHVKDAKVEKRQGSSSNVNKLGHINGHPRNNNKRQENSFNRSNSKSFEDVHHQNHGHDVQASSLAIDEVAVQAVVSILNGYIKHFLKDEDFRSTLRHDCFSSLDFIELDEEHSTETKVIRSLEQAIETIEQAAEESVPGSDLKRASLKLSIITGLNLNDLTCGFTCGIPNYKLSACAHLYLSVLYKMQRKDKVSAKHLLQVFCDSPRQARTTLMPELWEYLFSPHLSHLKVWYQKEADIQAGTTSRTRKLRVLEKVYNENLDSGTYLLAVYYKDWLTEGVEAPSIPFISIPSIPALESQPGSSHGHSSDLASSVDASSPQPMVSKKLYDAVFGSLSKPGAVGDEDDKGEDILGNSVRSPDGPAVVKKTITYASEKVKYTHQDIEENFSTSPPVSTFHPKGMSVSIEEEWRERNLNDDIGNAFISQKTNVNSHMLEARKHGKGNEVTVKTVTRSVLELQSTKSSFDCTVSTVLQSREKSVENMQSSKLCLSLEGLQFPSIPQEFICPLTETLFQDPVTLETGQTFERAAIETWFEKGNRTCPITGNTLDFVAIPQTNLVLKRLIDNWKSEQLHWLLDFASQNVRNPGKHKLKEEDEANVFKLESFVTSLSEEDKTNYAKYLMSLGVLEFLLRRFELGNMEEKTRVVALLLTCIEADCGCIYQIAREINKKCLLELLHSEEVNPTNNAVLLLTELLSLKRRNDVISFLSGMMGEDVFNTMHFLLIYLEKSPPHQKPLIAVLLLHFDQLVELEKYSIYREQAVNAIAMALDASLHDEKVQEKCCRALSILGGLFCSTGKILTMSSILKQAGYNNDKSEGKPSGDEEEPLLWDGTISLEYEERRREEGLSNLLDSLIGDGERPFLKTVSRCLESKNQDLVEICLITVTWLSSSLTKPCNAGLHLPAFLAVISQLKGILENGELELKILALMSLLNFSKISECKTLLMTMAEDIAEPLHRLADVTWAAKQLHAIVSGADL
ncbi:hypothetical protein L6164_013391 [Bauhinia variegata]|uniref:Uncharacterized protein n=1 Tax=Bauhinia variegata TaxID=167791 RepID=A0ACB9NFR5_BAUVA|nr:hypothetical protein L6164_013391 [Bauhinia variegata]